MANEYAEKFSNPNKLKNQESLSRFNTIMGYLSPTDQVSYYAAAGMLEKACEVLMSEGRYKDLYRIYKAQGWHEEGIQLAKKHKDREDEEEFMLFKATEELKSESGMLTDTTIEMLKKKYGFQSEREARIGLIYGMGLQKYSITKSAYQYYKRERHSIGQVEAFNICVARAEYDVVNQKWKNIVLDDNVEDLLGLVLSACTEITTIMEALSAAEPTSIQSQLLSQIESFYEIERKVELHEVFYIPSLSYPWTNEVVKDVINEDVEVDADGMLVLNIKKVNKSICNRLDRMIKK